MHAFVDDPAPRLVACVIEGEPGIGKTSLWRAAVAAADNVRVSRPREAEASFAFAALADLFADLRADVLDSLRPPQRRALEVALLLREARGRPPEPHAVGAATLTALRALAPLVVAIDDIQWLDRASADALAFALRRLTPADDVRVVATLRTAGEDVTRAIDDAQVERIDLLPLSFGAVQRLVADRAPQSLPRRVVRRLYDASGGNPFFAIELARNASPAGDIGMPDSLVALVGSKLERVDAEAERAVLLTALLADPRPATVGAVVDRPAVEAAIGAALLDEDTGALRLAHPLIGTAARERARPEDLRTLHLRLAEVVAVPEERIRHRALGTVPPDAAVAAELEAVAGEAAARGAVVAAAELSEQAWRYTAPAAPERVQRAITAAEAYRRIGGHVRGRSIIEHTLPQIESAPERVRALFQLALLHPSERPDAFDDALREATGALRAEILAEKAERATIGNAEDVRPAHGWSSEAVELAREARDPRLVSRTLGALAWMEMLLGRDPERLLREAEACATDHPLFDDADRIRGVRAVWRGELPRARDLLTRLLERAVDQEEEFCQVIFVHHLLELELRAGDQVRLAQRAFELEDVVAPFADTGEALMARARAAVAAGHGDLASAVRELDRCRGAAGGSVGWLALDAHRTAGLAALAAGDATAAADHLCAVRNRVDSAGIEDPGAFPFAADLVEALAGVGRREEAAATLSSLERAAETQEHPWALATAARARAHLLSAAGDLDGAEVSLRRALALHGTLELPLDEARARLALGAVHRRARRRREARAELESAHGAFVRLGATGFAERAAEELARVAGRRRAEGLTPTEQRVAGLVAEGLTNRQIAERLVVSVAAIEAHLTRIYAKLGVRRRTELVLKVSGSPD